MTKKKIILFFIILISFLSLFGIISTSMALVLGISFGLCKLNPFPKDISSISKLTLQGSVVLLGFGLSINSVLEVGKIGFVLTTGSIFITLAVGLLLGKLMKVQFVDRLLISFGTAICGGSAIAAVAPVLKAKNREISIAMATVFSLNAIALFIFPSIGHYLKMTQEQFGLWVAIAIHDTSSVVGAASVFGEEALRIATTVKLTRALWIVPFVSFLSFKMKSNSKAKVPLFIIFFIFSVILNSYIPSIGKISPFLVKVAKGGMALSLFLIGMGIHMDDIKKAGVKNMAYGTILWIFISVSSCLYIMNMT